MSALSETPAGRESRLETALAELILAVNEIRLANPGTITGPALNHLSNAAALLDVDIGHARF